MGYGGIRHAAALHQHPQIDCDVIQADGGTRTAAITGSFVALYQAFQHLVRLKVIASVPLPDQVAAISCGLVKGEAVLDLDYAEDSTAEADANFVLTGTGKLVEVQATAEQHPFEEAALARMLALAQTGVARLVGLQKQALGLG